MPHNFDPKPEIVRTELAELITGMANFVDNSPQAFSKAFVAGLRSVAARATSINEPMELPGFDIGPHDAVNAMERLNLTEPTTPKDGEFLVGADEEGDDLRLEPGQAVELIGYSLGVTSGRSLMDPVRVGIQQRGETNE